MNRVKIFSLFLCSLLFLSWSVIGYASPEEFHGDPLSAQESEIETIDEEPHEEEFLNDADPTSEAEDALSNIEILSDTEPINEESREEEFLNDVDSTSKAKDALSIIEILSEEEAIDLAMETIQSVYEQSDPYPWNETTEINETVEMYDFQGNVNSYLFRLLTDDEESGYIVINAVADTATAEIYCPDGLYALDVIGENEYGYRFSSEDHIIHPSVFAFIIEQEDGTFLNLANDEIVDAPRSELLASYKTLVENRKKAMTRRIKLSAALPGTYKMPNSDFHAFKTSDFGDDNNCVPTAMTNLIYYWGVERPMYNSNLWSGQVYQNLKHWSGWTPSFGTFYGGVIPALLDFGDSRNVAIIDSESKWYGDIDWAWLTEQIYNDFPLIIGIEGHEKYGNHGVCVFGYRYNDGNTKLIIADGWVSSTSTEIDYIYNTDIIYGGYTNYECE